MNLRSKRLFLKIILPVLIAVSLPADSLFAQEMCAGEEDQSIEAIQKNEETESKEVQQKDAGTEEETKEEPEDTEQANEKQEQIIEADDLTISFGDSVTLEVKAPGMIFSYEVTDGTDKITFADGVVTGIKVGEAKIKIIAEETEEYERAEKEITVTVVTSLSEGTFKKSEIIKEGISLTWNPIEGAEGYYLYRKKSGDSSWKKVKITDSAQDVSYVDQDVEEGGKYYYRVKAYKDSGMDIGEAGETETVVYVLPPTIRVTLSPSGTQVQWNRPVQAGGYYVYRREASQSSYKKVATLSEPGEVTWIDSSAENGKLYYYAVRTKNGSSVSVSSAEKCYVRVSVPTVTSWKRVSSTKIKLSWNRNTSASGYQIQYSKSRVFSGAKTITFSGNGTSSYTVSKLSKNQSYYARIRAYKVVNGVTYYSAWSASSNIKTSKTLSASVLIKKKKVFEIRTWAKQNLYQYDVLQGSCTDGIYAYYLLNYNKAQRCKVVKVRMSDLKVVKVSAPLSVAHGNDMTYNPHTKSLVIVHSTGEDPKALSSVNPDTLTITESKHITIPNKLTGGSTTDAKNATAFTGIAYSAGRAEYAVLLSHNYNFVILDAKMNPVKYVKVTKQNNYKMQGIDATDDYILVAQSPKSSKQKYNIITVYDWEGNYISKINVKKGYEIESVYHVGSKYYAGFYRSYYKTYYKTVIKKVKVKGKIKKKKVKVKYRKFMRDNYVYRITGI